MKAIVLSYDRNRATRDHMIHRYAALWPDHPFIFRVPCQETPGPHPDHRVEFRKTPPEIKATVLALLDDLPDEEWIYWCIDDKYPIRLKLSAIKEIVREIGAGDLADADGVLFCRCRRFWDKRFLTGRTMRDACGHKYLERGDYRQIWIHQFLRVKVLRHLFSSFPDLISIPREMDTYKDRLPKPEDHRLFVTRHNHAVFGESTYRGVMTVDCRRSMIEAGMELPPWAERTARHCLFGTWRANLRDRLRYGLINLREKLPVLTRRRILLLAGAMALALLIAEGATRLSLATTDREHLAALRREPSRPGDGKAVTLGEMIRLADDPRIIYELIPGIRVRFMGVEVSINEDGFRGERVPRARSRDAGRIVGIGDSLIFGWGVRDSEGFLHLLAQRLAEHHPGRRWEVINTAVPGYNTVMQVATLEKKALAWNPDLVIITFVGNDLGLPNFIREPADLTTLRHSFLLELFGLMSRGSALVEMDPALMAASRRGDQVDAVPAEYRNMIGPEAYRAAMKRLKELSLERGFEVIVVSEFVAPPLVRRTCDELGFTLVDVAPFWRRYAAAQGVTDADAAWRLSREDPHPSPLGHRAIAEAILDACETRIIASGR